MSRQQTSPCLVGRFEPERVTLETALPVAGVTTRADYAQNDCMVDGPGGTARSLTPFQAPGWYEDDAGREDIVWIIGPSTRRTPPGQAGFEIHTTIRGFQYWGYDLDGLSTDDGVELDGAGLRTCTVGGELPSHVTEGGRRRQATIAFELDLKRLSADDYTSPKYLRLILQHGGRQYEVADEWFEDGIAALQKVLPVELQLVCCWSCLYSDYSPSGHGLIGMDCHRGAKAQYLAVRSKQDYWRVPRLEEVMETHLCPEYETRVPGTGYRG